MPRLNGRLGAVCQYSQLLDKKSNVLRSDKLARWNVMGVQGAMLSEVLEEPLYMQSLTVALPHCTTEVAHQARAALWRAVAGPHSLLPLRTHVALGRCR